MVVALCVAVIALTLGQIGHSTEDTPNFATQLHQVSRSSNRLPLTRDASFFWKALQLALNAARLQLGLRDRRLCFAG